MRGFGFGAIWGARRRGATSAFVPGVLQPLSLAASGIIENSAAGTVVGGVLGATAGSALGLVDTAGGRFALAGGNLVAGATATDFESATTHQVTVRETLAGASNSPRDTVLTVAVGNVFEQPNLAALGLSATSLTTGTAAAGAITGATAGSMIAASGLPAGLTINGAARTWAWSGSGSAVSSTITLTETLADSANSPRASSVGVTIAAPAPAPAPAYLAASPAPHAAYASQRIVAGYTGPIYRLRRASDAAEQDWSAQAGGDYPKVADIVAWAGGASLTVSAIYDQSGNARHLTQATLANQPSFDPADLQGGAVWFLFDGALRLAPLTTKNMSAGGLALNRSGWALFAAVDAQNSYNQTTYFALTGDPATTAYRSLGNNLGAIGALTAAPQAQPAVYGVTNNTTTLRIFSRNTTVDGSASTTAQAMPRLLLGSTVGGTGQNASAMKVSSVVLYDSFLSVAAGNGVVANLQAMHALPTAFDYRLVLGGDSIQEGSGGTLLRNTTHLLRRQLARSAETYTPAVHGQTAANVYANRATQYGAYYTAAIPSIAFVEAGTNDLAAGTTGASLYANTTGPLITYLKGQGYKVVVSTLLPRTGSSGWTAAMETERTSYNSTVVANGAGADFVLDLASHPVMGASGAPADATLFQADRLHPTSLGYTWLAGAPSGTYASQYSYYYAVQQVLRAVTGNAGYVP